MDGGTHEDHEWQIVMVVDPTGEVREYAYTETLAGFGVPDLHLGSLPTEGEDPGEDWSLSSQDGADLLNDLAARLMSGAIGPGGEGVESYHGGLVTVRYQLGTPVPALTLDALRLPPDAPVIPVRWSLHRPPLTEAAPLDVVTHALMTARVRAVQAESGRRRWTGGGFRSLPQPPWRSERGRSERGRAVDLSVEQRFGPLTPLVMATAEQIHSASGEVLEELLHHGAEIHTSGVLGRAHGWATALARATGRHDAMTTLAAEVPLLTGMITGSPNPTQRWGRATSGTLRLVPAPEQDDLRSSMAHALGRTVLITLMGEVLADVAPPELLAMTRGPWAWAWSSAESHAYGCGCRPAPGPAWTADPRAESWVGDRLAALPLSRASALDSVMEEAVITPEYGTFTDRLLAHRLTGPCSPAAGVVTGRDGVVAVPEGARHGLCHLARLLLVGVTSIERVTDDDWTRLVAPAVPFVPALRDRPTLLSESI